MSMLHAEGAPRPRAPEGKGVGSARGEWCALTTPKRKQRSLSRTATRAGRERLQESESKSAHFSPRGLNQPPTFGQRARPPAGSQRPEGLRPPSAKKRKRKEKKTRNQKKEKKQAKPTVKPLSSNKKTSVLLQGPCKTSTTKLSFFFFLFFFFQAGQPFF